MLCGWSRIKKSNNVLLSIWAGHIQNLYESNLLIQDKKKWQRGLIAIIAAFSTVLTIYLFEKMDFQSVLVYDICFTLLMSILYFIELYLEYYFDNVFRVRSFKRVKFLHFDRFRKSLIPGVISLITLTAFTLSTGLERFFELFNEFCHIIYNINWCIFFTIRLFIRPYL